MRRSFGGGGGRNMGGGGMIRNVQRAFRAGVGGPSPESFSCSGAVKSRTAQNLNEKKHSSATTALTLSSPNSNNINGTSGFCSLINFPLSSSSSADESEWECVDGVEEGRAVVICEDYKYDDDVFGSVPSTEEVHHAVSALQQAFAPSAANEVFEKQISSEMDWIEPSPHLWISKMPDRSVYDAFHLLETEPCVQRMVISLSSDKAVWDAVMNNEVVKELRGSIYEEADGLIVGCDSDEGCDDSNPVKDILSWILANGKAKIMQVVDGIRKLVQEAFQGRRDGDCADPFQEKLRTSLLLSVMVLVVVVITRAAKTV